MSLHNVLTNVFAHKNIRYLPLNATNVFIMFWALKETILQVLTVDADILTKM